MEDGAIDYLSFVRGFLAATDPETSDGDEPTVPPANGHALDPDSFAEGYAVARTREFPVTYRELSVRDDGRFTGTLDLGEASGFPADERPHLSGTLDL
ncbi:hypothetical protein DI005_31200 [Prauserella sp. PE36]|uniref:hypothetical protein n=1 Tax=Prauserella sp. PE36 TaxID=1504709 RepID=UPI000D9C1221|nr:hypothetical protein [Prauserella sp. PE36]PXY34632.1 hypothetical protein BAY59_03690 [Prauserella coralliicola]RBM12915.1 hypothetical protein DI005_31200 [Prauserella sp. PE36]